MSDLIDVRTARGIRRLLAGLGMALLVLAGCGEDEQGGLQGASPGPDAVVGGEIDRIELLYDDIIAEVDGAVTGPDGAELGAEFVIDNQIRALIELEQPLTAPGEYTVRHVVVSVVDDRVEDAYTFTYQPDASPPQLVFPPEDDSGVPWLLWTIAIVGAIVIVVLIGRLVISMRRLKAPPKET